MIGYSCTECGRELECEKNGVILVHFIDDNPEEGIDAARRGDLYECPYCGCGVVIGLAQQEFYCYDIPVELKDYIMNNYKSADDIVVIKRG